jgi:hypothetical protein
MKEINLPEFRIVDYDDVHKIQFRKKGKLRNWKDLPYGCHNDYVSANEHKKCLVRMVRSFNSQYYCAYHQFEKLQSLIFGYPSFSLFKDSNKKTVVIQRSEETN